MPSYKDKNGKWYCQFYYTDHTGKHIKKFKRGFALKREADAWEQDYLKQVQGSPNMSVSALAALYLEDIKLNCKAVTYRTRESRVRIWILPFFENKPINEIKTVDIKNWHNELKKAVNVRNEPLSTGYIGTLHREMSAMMNYAVKYYDLRRNPCQDAGNIKKSRVKSLDFWTLEEFNQFIDTFEASDPFRTAFITLYYTGMRVGELQALTVGDIDFENNRISVSKTFHVINGEYVITDTKTAKGNRIIYINASLADLLCNHISRLYKPRKSDRIFTMTPSSYGKQLNKHAGEAGIQRIRVHDLRHSHVSLLINMGVSPLVISERLGHEKVSTTLDIYAHLYPSKQDEITGLIEDQFKK